MLLAGGRVGTPAAADYFCYSEDGSDGSGGRSEKKRNGDGHDGDEDDGNDGNDGEEDEAARLEEKRRQNSVRWRRVARQKSMQRTEERNALAAAAAAATAAAVSKHTKLSPSSKQTKKDTLHKTAQLVPLENFQVPAFRPAPTAPQPPAVQFPFLPLQPQHQVSFPNPSSSSSSALWDPSSALVGKFSIFLPLPHHRTSAVPLLLPLLRPPPSASHVLPQSYRPAFPHI
ncbi:hypothetical protein BASA81_008037 [Batrachochytrium salamandrivorans]|nr:hypothetical protein BASA81_008037 [Batrachochytrium salamandrivorans]